MGAADAAIRPERWAWVTITRKNNELRTYVNGRLCSKLDVTVKQPKPKEKKPSKAEDKDKEEEKKEEEKDVVKLPERFCVDPLHLALFPPTDVADGADEGERGVTLCYFKLTTEFWEPERVRAEMEALRGHDEEADLEAAAEEARAHQLCLQPLYAKPPPIWMHPAFSAEFGDAYVGGTGLEGGSLHISLEVVVLALQRALRQGGAAEALPHDERSAINSALAALQEAKRLAHKLAHAMEHEGQARTSPFPIVQPALPVTVSRGFT